MTGVYGTATAGATGIADALSRLLRMRKFWLGLLFVVLVAMSDGYYAFFALLLLGFATLCRVVAGDWREPGRLLAPAGAWDGTR